MIELATENEITEELTKLEADDLVDRIAEYNAKIKAAEAECNEFKTHYQMKIAAAEKICEEQCKVARQEIATLTETLRRYAIANLPEGRKSITLPSGTLSFCKQQPKFFIDGQEASGKSKALLDYAKVNAPEYVKTSEFVDWAGLKKKIKVEGEEVYNAETGEIIEGLRMQTYPDTFTVKVKEGKVK